MNKVNEILLHKIPRPQNKRSPIRIIQDFENCVSIVDQHAAKDTDLNHLMAKYKPDELAAYIYARSQHKIPMWDHDFSNEPNLQEAKNLVYQLKQTFESLPDDLKRTFGDHVNFLKYIDHPSNRERLVKLGILKQSQIAKIVSNQETAANPETAVTTPTQEKEDSKSK